MKSRSTFRMLTVAVFAVIAVVFWGCPYQSTVPVDEAGIKVPKSLFGKWIKKSNLEDENPTYYIIEKGEKNRFSITQNEYSTTDSEYSQTKYTGHISNVNDIDFMNILEEGSSEYYIYKALWMSDTQLKMFEVTNNITEKFNSSGELKAFIAKHMHLSFFFNKDPEIYIKQ